MNNIQHVSVKIPRAKPYDCVVYPNRVFNNLYVVQASNRIFRANLDENTLTVSKSGKNSFMDLSEFFGATVIDLPEELAEQLRNLKPMDPEIRVM